MKSLGQIVCYLLWTSALNLPLQDISMFLTITIDDAVYGNAHDKTGLRMNHLNRNNEPITDYCYYPKQCLTGCVHTITHTTSSRDFSSIHANIFTAPYLYDYNAVWHWPYTPDEYESGFVYTVVKSQCIIYIPISISYIWNDHTIFIALGIYCSIESYRIDPSQNPLKYFNLIFYIAVLSLLLSDPTMSIPIDCDADVAFMKTNLNSIGGKDIECIDAIGGDRG